MGNQPKVAKIAMPVPPGMTQGQIGSLIQAGIIRAEAWDEGYETATTDMEAP